MMQGKAEGRRSKGRSPTLWSNLISDKTYSIFAKCITVVRLRKLVIDGRGSSDTFVHNIALEG